MLSWSWWTKSTQGLLARIAIGAAIFAVLATVDLVRHAEKATRWREYLFLVAGVVLACGYGIINDQITSRISWEYFYYGKGLDEVLGPRIPPDSKALAWGSNKSRHRSDMDGRSDCECGLADCQQSASQSATAPLSNIAEPIGIRSAHCRVLLDHSWDGRLSRRPDLDLIRFPLAGS